MFDGLYSVYVGDKTMLCCFKFRSYSETVLSWCVRACVYSVLSFQLLLSLLLLRTPHTHSIARDTMMTANWAFLLLRCWPKLSLGYLYFLHEKQILVFLDFLIHPIYY